MIGKKNTGVDKIFGIGYYILSEELSSNQLLMNAEEAFDAGEKVVLGFVPSNKIRKRLFKCVHIAILSQEQLSDLTDMPVDDFYSSKIAILKLYGMGAEQVYINMQNGKVLSLVDEVFQTTEELSFKTSAI